MNNRANILYFVEHLCDVAKRESHTNFVRMVKRDILKIVDSVAPDDGSGAANVKVIRKVCLLPLNILTMACTGPRSKESLVEFSFTGPGQLPAESRS